MHERPPPTIVETPSSRRRRLAAVGVAALLAVGFLFPSAKAATLFYGAADVKIDVLSFDGRAIEEVIPLTEQFTRFVTPPAAATASATSDVVAGGHIKLSAAAEGTAPVDFAEAAAFAAGVIGLGTGLQDTGLLSLSIDGPTLGATGHTDGAFVVIDFLVGFVRSELARGILDGLDFSAIPFDPADLFAPGELLFSCTMTRDDPTGCSGAGAFDGFAIGPDDRGFLVAVLGVQGSAQSGVTSGPADAVPAPSALGLLGLAVVGLGLVARRRLST